jgi:hypothetical protein
VKPLPYDPDKANQILLDSPGTPRSSDGIRVAPATTGKYAQPAHPMSYPVMVPDSLDFNGDREFQIIRANWAKIGVKITEQPGGDSGPGLCDRDRRPVHEARRRYGTGASTSTRLTCRC